MSPARRRVLASLALVAAVAAACAAAAGLASAAPPAQQRHYPPEIRRPFISSCAKTAKAVAGRNLTSAQARTYCTRALSCIERHLTLRQFERVVINMQTGRRNPNARVLTSCERAAIRTVIGSG